MPLKTILIPKMYLKLQFLVFMRLGALVSDFFCQFKTKRHQNMCKAKNRLLWLKIFFGSNRPV